MKYFDLSDEENTILNDFDNDAFVSVKDKSGEKRRYEQYAQQSLQKTRNINIRLSEKDLLKLKSKAVREGIPYQTLVASIIHRYTVA